MFLAFDEGLVFSDIVSSIIKYIGLLVSLDLFQMRSNTCNLNELLKSASSQLLLDKNLAILVRCLCEASSATSDILFYSIAKLFNHFCTIIDKYYYYSIYVKENRVEE